MPTSYFPIPKPELQPTHMSESVPKQNRPAGIVVHPLVSGVCGRRTLSHGLRSSQTILPPEHRRQLGCLQRSLRAALHAAEFAAWQASGGDFLRRSPAADIVPADPVRSY
jgi:hypothetical protein